MDHDHLLRVLNYDPSSGVFLWRRNNRRCRSGSMAGCVVNGYLRIAVDGRAYRAHRLAWFYVHGQWPLDQIDHIDGNPLNNALANLRECTNSQNAANSRRRRNNKSGYKGVWYSVSKKAWIARIKVHGRHFDLGRFRSPEAAHDAYCAAAAKHFGQFARTV